MGIVGRRCEGINGRNDVRSGQSAISKEMTNMRTDVNELALHQVSMLNIGRMTHWHYFLNPFPIVDYFFAVDVACVM